MILKPPAPKVSPETEKIIAFRVSTEDKALIKAFGNGSLGKGMRAIIESVRPALNRAVKEKKTKK